MDPGSDMSNDDMDPGSEMSDDDYDEYPQELYQGPFQKSMDDLQSFVDHSMTEVCKLHACVDHFLHSLVMSHKDAKLYYMGLEDLTSAEGEHAEPLSRALAELRANINRLLPRLLDHPESSDLMSHDKIKQKLEDRWSALKIPWGRKRGDWSLQPDQRRSADWPVWGAFQKSVNDALFTLRTRQSAGDKDTDAAPPTLSQVAIKDLQRQLIESIAGERASASFACGGTIPVVNIEAADNVAAFRRTVSPPVRVYWDSRDGGMAQKLVLPLNDTINHGPNQEERLRQLVADCDIATFGRGQQDVIDPEYRRAGKLNSDQFLSSFDPSVFGIIENVEQVLLPRFNTDMENRLPFRKLKAELYKLNIYSGPSGLFRKHVDTPRSESQIGSLVVCLPSPFKGGTLVVQHHGKEVEFDWSPQSGSSIQWAAFYSDCEHEIKTISEGERITLTYNLYVTEPAGGSIPPRVTVDPQTLPLYGFLRDLIWHPGFMKHGGTLGIYCSHAYPHASGEAQHLLPTALKGADLVVYSVLKSLGIEVDVLPVMKTEEEDCWQAPKLMISYLKEGKEFEPKYSQVPTELPMDLGVDEYWKALLLSRQVRGLKEVHRFAKTAQIPIENEEFWQHRGKYVAFERTPYRTTDSGQEMEKSEIVNDAWPAQYLDGITWLTKPTHEQMALSFVAYGNEASIGTMYSSAAILAVIPPFEKRLQMV